jgi:hypothetical protein
MATGRKTVVVGQVIDPDAWGNPLWDQSVQTFTSAADRTSQFPAPRQGAVTYLEDVRQLQVFIGTAWVLVHAGSVQVVGGLTGVYPGPPALLVRKLIANQAITPNASGEWNVMVPADYGPGGGVVDVDAHSTGSFDINIVARNNAGTIVLKAFNTAGTPVTTTVGYSADITYWITAP